MKRGEIVDRTNPEVYASRGCCRDCLWNKTSGPNYPYGHIQRAVRRHVAETGHEVIFTKSCVTTYRPIEEPA